MNLFKILVKVFLGIGIFFSLVFSVNAFDWGDIFSFGAGNADVGFCKTSSECGLEKGVDAIKKEGLGGIDTDKGAVEFIVDLIVYFLGFLFLIAVIIIIYAGFTILVSLGEDEKVSNAKKMILYAIIGIVIIFFAWIITDFVFKSLNEANTVPIPVAGGTP